MPLQLTLVAGNPSTEHPQRHGMLCPLSFVIQVVESPGALFSPVFVIGIVLACDELNSVHLEPQNVALFG